MRRRYLLAEFLTGDNAFIKQALPQKTTASLRWNGVSSAYLTLRDSHPVIPELTAEPGVRCRLWFVETEGTQLRKRPLLEGRLGTLAGNDAPYGTVTVPVLDDAAEFETMLGWQVPDAAISAQGTSEYARYAGTSEDNALAAIAANADRLGKPWDVAPSLHRGTITPLELRMHSLAEKIMTPLINDRLQLVIQRVGERWNVDVREGDEYARPITPQSGVLGSWSWVQQPATATRAVVGGRGDGVDREFVLVVDTALEAELGYALEIFVDARNADEGADLEPYGWAKLAEHRAKAGLTAQLRETSWFRFGEAYDLGTKLTVQVGALSVQDVITQIDITHDSNGFVAVPTVGLATSDPQERLVGFVKNVATSVRALERR